jgi:endonuclease IV
MSITFKAIYKDGAFVPVANGEKLNVPENTEVELTVHNPYIVPATAKNEEERERAWRELLESWDAYPLRADAPRLTRDEMHERR